MSDGFVRLTAKMQGGSDVARLLNRYPEKVGRTLESLVKQEARGLAVELARNTRPFGFSEKAKKRGEKAVAGDLFDYIEQVTTATGIEIALRVAAGRLRKALATSLRVINEKTNARMKRAG